MAIGTLLVYIFIGLGAGLVIIAFIYTKWIKPASFSYTGNNIWIRYQFKRLFKNLIERQKLVKGHQDVTLTSTEHGLVMLDYLYFGYDHVYVIAKSLYWNIETVEFTGNHYEIITKRHKRLELPLDVQLFLKSVKHFKKAFNLSSELVVIIPSLNKNFKPLNINNTHFMYYEQMANFINQHETSTTSQITTLQGLISAQIRAKKKRTLGFKRAAN